MGAQRAPAGEDNPVENLGCGISLAWAGGILLVIFVLWAVFSGIYTEWTWFDSLGFASVYRTILLTQVYVFLAATAVFSLAMIANLLLARKLSSRGDLWFIPRQELVPGDRWILLLLIGGSVLLGLLMGASAAGNWEGILLYRNAASFGATDPLFGQDISFFTFVLPFYRFLQSWLIAAVVLILAATVLTYGFNFGRRRFDFRLTPAIKGHVSALGAVFFLLLAWNFWLDIYEIVYSTRGVVFGAGYTDVSAQWGALQLLASLAVISAILLVVNVFLRGVLLPAIGVGLLLVAAIVAAGIYPAFVQQFQVEPSELAKEKPFIESNIKMTRQAYGLDGVEEKPFPAQETLAAEALRRNRETINNVRLWDYRPLRDTYNQIQTIRLYYDFNDVDIDRYQIDGQLRQVMLSVRELSPEKLAQEAQTWVNRRLQFTHGYGVAVSPVNEVTPEGLPVLFAKDVPPTGQIKIARPEIYYGEKTSSYVIVNTKEKEFDYPKGDENVYTNYAGQSGIMLNSSLRKMAFAWSLNDANILLTNYLTQDSRLLMRRNIRERVEKLAPFLIFDRDPYIVIADGRLVWVVDGYTHTNRYPYSQPYQDRLNYIRNSVKVTVDAYDGSVKFYVADPSDPVIRTYAAIFPALFSSLNDMPASLRGHLRYPEGLFNVQATMYRTYHMQDPQVFYNREDLWSIPARGAAGGVTSLEPYYIIMKIPGETKAEFMLILPYTPSNKDNMITWLAARSDGENYGKLLAYRFPKDKLVYGPNQIEARINQDPTISQQLTLWNQLGSRVIRGNLLVIPIEQSLLYVEPIYLQAETSHLPELKRIVVANGPRIAMESTLADSLSRVFEGMAPTTGVTTITPLSPAIAGTVVATVRSAQDHYNRAIEAQRAGDWAKYGEEQKALEADLKRLSDLAGAP
ncbi:MAG: UPF0182 family protein [Chloroflexi bacterium]|nr:UPF0182 family protein [Chloroflexota bacterium]